MAGNIADFLIEIGFDTDAIKGIKKIESQLKGLERQTTRQSKLEEKSAKDKFKRDRQEGNALQDKIRKRKEAANQYKIEAELGRKALNQRLNQFKKEKAKGLAEGRSVEQVKVIAKQKIKAERDRLNKERGLQIKADRDKRKLESETAQKNLNKRLESLKKEKALKEKALTLSKKQIERDNELARKAKFQRDRERGLAKQAAVKKARMEEEVAKKSLQKRLDYQKNLKQFRQDSIGRITSRAGYHKLSSVNRESIRQDLEQVKTKGDVERISQRIANINRGNLATQKKTNFLLRRQVESSKQLAGNMISAFAVVGAGVSISKIGMDMESLNAGMIIASGTSQQVEKDMKFLKDTAYELGIDLKTAAKAYQQLAIAGKGVISSQQIKDLFIATAESSVVLGMSMDETKGTVKAFEKRLTL